MINIAILTIIKTRQMVNQDKLEQGKTYLFRILIGNKDLVFTGKLSWVRDGFFSFLDKFQKQEIFNLNCLVSFTEK
jgi:hypothetical protein